MDIKFIKIVKFEIQKNGDCGKCNNCKQTTSGWECIAFNDANVDALKQCNECK